jgi:hypothetical protein
MVPIGLQLPSSIFTSIPCATISLSGIIGEIRPRQGKGIDIIYNYVYIYGYEHVFQYMNLVDSSIL